MQYALAVQQRHAAGYLSSSGQHRQQVEPTINAGAVLTQPAALDGILQGVTGFRVLAATRTHSLGFNGTFV